MVGKQLSPKIYSVTVVVSIALHAALAFLVKVPQPPKLQPLKTVKITDLIAPKISATPAARPESKPKTTSPQPSLTAQPRSAAQTSQSVTQTAPIETQASRKARSVPVVSQPVVNAAQNQPQTPTPTASPTLSPTSTEPTASGTVSELFAQLGSGSLTANHNSPSPSLFTDPSKFFEQGNASTPTFKPEILRAMSIAEKAPSAVYVDILVTQGQSTNFQVSERGNYGGGTVYQVTQGNHTWYFNLLPTKDTTGTLIVVWQNDPSVSIQ